VELVGRVEGNLSDSRTGRSSRFEWSDLMDELDQSAFRSVSSHFPHDGEFAFVFFVSVLEASVGAEGTALNDSEEGG
jgi:hypothetical protein